MKKLSVWVPITREMLYPPEVTDADRKRWMEQEYDEKQDLLLHTQRVHQAEGFLRPVLGLHEPVFEDGQVVCTGCSVAGMDWEHPEWPCSTYELAVAWMKCGRST